MIVEHSFGVWIVCIHRILYELCSMVKKEERKKKERRRKKYNKIKIFAIDFLDCEENSWNLGAIFDIHVKIAKVFHLQV